MSDSAKSQKMQPTQPKKGEPIEIPVPKRSAFDKLVKKAAQASRQGKH